MPRDYAKRPPRPRHAPIPGWIWLTSGLIIGLFVALLVYLDRQPAEPIKLPDLSAPPMRDTREVRKEAPEAPPAPSSKPRFEFYSILPELEVAVPEEELRRAEQDQQNRRSTEPRATAPASAVQPGQSYILQAGSFKQFKEADGFKARLALIGLEADIQSVNINGTEWHRVRLGPFADLDALNRAREQLGAHGLEAMVLKVKG